MNNLCHIYSPEMPECISRVATAPSLRRLAGVGMNCGNEYVAGSYSAPGDYYSRLRHSMGVGLIVWHFTHDPAASVAGALHDVASPVFSHVVDFMNGDHLTQQSTEDGTREIIEADRQLTAQLRRMSHTVDDVCDYHRYPIADNDSPRLSADRLEYTLGNLLHYRLADLPTVTALYRDLTIATNEDGQPEMAFQSLQTAQLFGRLMLQCSHIYVSDLSRYSMQRLALLLREAISLRAITLQDLHTTEAQVISALRRHPFTSAAWDDYCHINHIRTNPVQPDDTWLRVDAKKRYINPLVGTAHPTRLTALDSHFSQAVDQFTSQSFDYYMKATSEG